MISKILRNPCSKISTQTNFWVNWFSWGKVNSVYPWYTRIGKKFGIKMVDLISSQKPLWNCKVAIFYFYVQQMVLQRKTKKSTVQMITNISTFLWILVFWPIFRWVKRNMIFWPVKLTIISQQLKNIKRHKLYINLIPLHKMFLFFVKIGS